MAIRAADPITPFWYTPESEKDKEGPTRFHLKPLDGVEMFEVKSRVKFEDGNLVIPAGCARSVLQASMLGWENFIDGTGPIEFSANRAVNIKRIPVEMVDELFNAILNCSAVSETARKN